MKRGVEGRLFCAVAVTPPRLPLRNLPLPVCLEARVQRAISIPTNEPFPAHPFRQFLVYRRDNLLGGSDAPGIPSQSGPGYDIRCRTKVRDSKLSCRQFATAHASAARDLGGERERERECERERERERER